MGYVFALAYFLICLELCGDVCSFDELWFVDVVRRAFPCLVRLGWYIRKEYCMGVLYVGYCYGLAVLWLLVTGAWNALRHPTPYDGYSLHYCLNNIMLCEFICAFGLVWSQFVQDV